MKIIIGLLNQPEFEYG